MQASQDRPPYVVFESRSTEDRSASLFAGHYVGKDLNFAIITPQGSKDKIERIAEEWLDNLAIQVRDGRFPPDWLASYKSIYKDWLEGREIPENGTAILTWPAISEAQQKTILAANIRTVEDLAIANESALNSIGMGARALVHRAQVWLETAKDTGKAAAESEKVSIENQSLLARNEALEAQIRELQAQVGVLKSLQTEDA